MIKKTMILGIVIFTLLSNGFSANMIGGEETVSRQFHDYLDLTNELQEIASLYPEITELYDLGKSVQDRSIWGLKITDNPGTEENEPEIRVCGCHHGDEEMSVEIPLLLAWELVQNYTVDSNITELVNTREIWIIPMVNPDGRMLGQRYNANNVDLNRDYGYIWEPSSGSTAPFSQPETQVIRQHALDNNFVFSFSFHTSGDIVNYVWNHKGNPTPDHEVVEHLSEIYGSYNGYWVVEGYDWYRITGDTNDFSYGCRGDLDWTIETNNTDISRTWNQNKPGMLEIIEAANMGLSGVVTDEITGEPIPATIWVEEAYWPCFNDPSVGDYHKPLLPGNYTVHVRANRYQEETFTAEVTTLTEPTIINVNLSRSDDVYAYQVTWYICEDPYYYDNNYQNNPTEGISSLGPPDGVFASIGKGGEIVLDMGFDQAITDGVGNDLTVYEGDAEAEGYFVEVSSNWNGPWESLGSGMGTSSFDLNYARMESARYVRITDDNDGSAYDVNPGFDLDAIQSLHFSDNWIRGIDVSSYQPSINWTRVGENNLQFCYVRSTIGSESIDSNLDVNMEEGKNNGISMGVYHYATPTNEDALSEASFFINTTKEYLTFGYLLPVLYIEQGSELGKQVLSEWIHEWMAFVENETTVRPILSVSSDYASEYLNSSISEYSLWIRNWTDSLEISPSIGIWDEWDLWQFSQQDDIDGVDGLVNKSVINGRFQNLKDYVISPQPLFLSSGWNCVSIPFNKTVNPSDITINYNSSMYSWSEAWENGLIEPSVFYWDTLNQRYDYMISDDVAFHAGVGYWLFAYDDCSIYFEEKEKPSWNETVQSMVPGWINVGIPFSQKLQLGDFKILYDGEEYNWSEAWGMSLLEPSVFYFNASIQQYQYIIEDDAYIFPGQGLWIYSYINGIIKI